MNIITARPRRLDRSPGSLDEPLPMSVNPTISAPTPRTRTHKQEHCLSISSGRSLTFPIPAGTVITEITIMRGNLSTIPTGLNLSIILRENASAASPAVETLHADVAMVILNDGSVINYRHNFARSYSHDHMLHLVLSQEVVGYEIVVLAKTREYAIKPSTGMQAVENPTSVVNEEVPAVLNHRHTVEGFRSNIGTVRAQPLKSGTPRRLQNTASTVTPTGRIVCDNCGKSVVDCRCQSNAGATFTLNSIGRLVCDNCGKYSVECNCHNTVEDSSSTSHEGTPACPTCGTHSFRSHGICVNGHTYPTR